MSSVSVVARRELNQIRHSPAYRLATIVGIVAIIALSFLPTILEWVDSRQLKRITTVMVVDQSRGIVAEATAMMEALPEDQRPPVAFEAETGDLTELDAKLEKGEIRAYLLVTPTEIGRTEPEFTLVTKGVSNSLTRSVRQVIEPVAKAHRLADLSMTADQAEALQAPARFSSRSIVEKTNEGQSRLTSEIISYCLLFLLYMSVVVYGGVLTNAVAAEKGSRVMEMMLVSAKPTHLLAGKMIGFSAAALSQFSIWGAMALILAALRGTLANLTVAGVPLQLSAVPTSTIVFFVIFYLLGFFAYGSLFAAAGCLVSRPEDSSQTIGPVMLIVLLGYWVAFLTLQEPSSTFSQVASFIPILTPMVMFMRIVLTNVPAWEIILAILLSLGFLVGAVVTGARIYRNSILRTRRTGWLDGLRGTEKRA